MIHNDAITTAATGIISSRDPLDVSAASSSSIPWDDMKSTPTATISDTTSLGDGSSNNDPIGIDLTLSPMLRRYPSFIPLRRRATSIAEVAFLVPSAKSSLRKATVVAATFNLTATIIGGGVLSIPLACARAGILPFTALMMVSAFATDLSLYLLVSCSRRCGSTSFGAVARAAYGPMLELFTTVVITFLVGCTVVGLMILNQGIWSPIVVEGIASLRGRHYSHHVDNEEEVVTPLQDAMVLLLLLLVMMPFLLKKDLTSLCHICYVGFFSIAILCVAMVYRDVEMNAVSHPGRFQNNVRWMAGSVVDMLSALPIILQAFLCSFNVISVSCALVDPTRERVKKVIHEAVFLSFVLMYIFGVSGYLFAYDDTDGNILLNFDPKDKVIFLGRVGCGITTLFALPMNVLPTREALISLVAQISEARARREATLEERRHLVERRMVEDEQSSGGNNVVDTTRKTRAASVSEQNAKKADEENGNMDKRNNLQYGTAGKAVPTKNATTFGSKMALRRVPTKDDENKIHFISTFGIVLVCYVVAVVTPGVAIVWDITGSSMAFLLQFIIPSVCYIRLKTRASSRHKSCSNNLVLARVLLVFAVVMSVVCTAITALRLAIS